MVRLAVFYPAFFLNIFLYGRCVMYKLRKCTKFKKQNTFLVLMYDFGVHVVPKISNMFGK